MHILARVLVNFPDRFLLKTMYENIFLYLQSIVNKMQNFLNWSLSYKLGTMLFRTQQWREITVQIPWIHSTLWANFVVLRPSCGAASLFAITSWFLHQYGDNSAPQISKLPPPWAASAAALGVTFGQLSICFLIFIAMSMSWPTVSLQSLICRMCSSRTETWRWRSTMSIFTAGAISSRPPRRTPATRGKWVWQRRQHRLPELMATQSCRYHYGEPGRDDTAISRTMACNKCFFYIRLQRLCLFILWYLTI